MPAGGMIMKCRHCSAEIPDAVKFCGTCGKKQAKTNKTLWLVLGALVLSFLAIMIPGAIQVALDDAKMPQIHRNAYLISRDFVRDRLTAPSSASFPNSADPGIKVTPLGDDKYTVIGWVESKNAFGVLLKRQYRCTVRFTGGNNWHLEDTIVFF
jgi:hypothetical protein